MATRIRLSRQGRKKQAFFHIIVADQKSPRDGRFIEKIGTYDPNVNPAKIELNFDSALNWLLKGAQPTNTARAILSYKGVLMKKHLIIGAKKGAFTEEEAEKRFEDWLKEKENKIKEKENLLEQKEKETIKEKIATEIEKNKERAKALEAKKSEQSKSSELNNTEDIKEEPKEEVKEEPKEEVKEET